MDQEKLYQKFAQEERSGLTGWFVKIGILRRKEEIKYFLIPICIAISVWSLWTIFSDRHKTDRAFYLKGNHPTTKADGTPI